MGEYTAIARNSKRYKSFFLPQCDDYPLRTENRGGFAPATGLQSSSRGVAPSNNSRSLRPKCDKRTGNSIDRKPFGSNNGCPNTNRKFPKTKSYPADLQFVINGLKIGAKVLKRT